MRIDSPFYVPELATAPENPVSGQRALYMRAQYLKILDNNGSQFDVGGNQPIYQEVATKAARDGLNWIAADAGKLVKVTNNSVVYMFDGTLPASTGFPLNLAFADGYGTTAQRDAAVTADHETGQKWTNSTTQEIQVWEGSWVTYGGGGGGGFTSYHEVVAETSEGPSTTMNEVGAGYQHSFTLPSQMDVLIQINGECQRNVNSSAIELEMRVYDGGVTPTTFQTFRNQQNNGANYPTFSGQTRINLGADTHYTTLWWRATATGNLTKVKNYSSSVREFPDS